MPSFVLIVVTAVLVLGAAARLTRLVGADTITAPIRAKITTWSNSTKISELLACPWCSGFWISAACTAIAWAVNDWPFTGTGLAAFCAAVLAVSYAVGILAQYED